MIYCHVILHFTGCYIILYRHLLGACGGDVEFVFHGGHRSDDGNRSGAWKTVKDYIRDAIKPNDRETCYFDLYEPTSLVTMVIVHISIIISSNTNSTYNNVTTTATITATTNNNDNNDNRHAQKHNDRRAPGVQRGRRLRRREAGEAHEAVLPGGGLNI